MTAKDGDSAECWRCGPSGCASWLDQRRMEQIYLGRLRDRCECLRKAFSRTLPQRADEAQELELEANGAGVLSGTGSVSPKPGTHGLGGSTRRWWRPAARSCLFGSAVLGQLTPGRQGGPCSGSHDPASGLFGALLHGNRMDVAYHLTFLADPPSAMYAWRPGPGLIEDKGLCSLFWATVVLSYLKELDTLTTKRADAAGTQSLVKACMRIAGGFLSTCCGDIRQPNNGAYTRDFGSL